VHIKEQTVSFPCFQLSITRQRRGEWIYNNMPSYPSHSMRARYRFHAGSALRLQKEPGTHYVGGCVIRCVKCRQNFKSPSVWNVVHTNPEHRPASCVLHIKGSFTGELAAGS
jgi:hypothetical protein